MRLFHLRQLWPLTKRNTSPPLPSLLEKLMPFAPPMRGQLQHSLNSSNSQLPTHVYQPKTSNDVAQRIFRPCVPLLQFNSSSPIPVLRGDVIAV